jgi:hypothetical protein
VVCVFKRPRERERERERQNKHEERDGRRTHDPIDFDGLDRRAIKTKEANRLKDGPTNRCEIDRDHQ